MMSYELFKTVFTDRIKDFMPEEYRDHRVEHCTVQKVNGMKDGFYLCPPKEDHRPMATLYFDDLYMDFTVDESMDRVLAAAAEALTCTGPCSVLEELGEDLPGLKDRLVVCLVNEKMNRALLDEHPHRMFMDMAAIYRVMVRDENRGFYSFVLTYDIMKSMGLTEEEVFDFALANTKRIFPADVLGGEESVYVMTNDAGIHGASTMLYEEDMQKLADRIGEDFFILPSSIHEFFAIPVSRSTPENLTRLLENGNCTVTRDAEILSGSIYRYSRETGAMEICSCA